MLSGFDKLIKKVFLLLPARGGSYGGNRNIFILIKNKNKTWELKDKQIRKRLKSSLFAVSWMVLGVCLFGLRVALRRGMSERNDGGMKAQAAPLGGWGDRTDPPCRKLITETISKSYYCGCNWGMEKINSLFPFLNVREKEKKKATTHSGIQEKKISVGKHNRLSLINRIFITATQPLCTHSLHIWTHTLLWGFLKGDCFVKRCWQRSYFNRTPCQQIIKRPLKAASKQKEQRCI